MERETGLRHCGSCELRYGENFLAFQDIQSDFNDPYWGRGCYDSGWLMKVSSDGFSGTGYWGCGWKDLCRFTEELGALYEFQCREVGLRDAEYGCWFRLVMNKTGRITVSGVLYGEARAQTLSFEFQADQAALKPFLQQLRQICDMGKDRGRDQP